MVRPVGLSCRILGVAGRVTTGSVLSVYWICRRICSGDFRVMLDKETLKRSKGILEKFLSFSPVVSIFLNK
jgi:hypothetical protein